MLAQIGLFMASNNNNNNNNAIIATIITVITTTPAYFGIYPRGNGGRHKDQQEVEANDRELRRLA